MLQSIDDHMYRVCDDQWIPYTQYNSIPIPIELNDLWQRMDTWVDLWVVRRRWLKTSGTLCACFCGVFCGVLQFSESMSRSSSIYLITWWALRGWWAGLVHSYVGIGTVSSGFASWLRHCQTSLCQKTENEAKHQCYWWRRSSSSITHKVPKRMHLNWIR